ncbi:MAG: signal peptide peptidase SppA [Deltaproteobacteria bacterium HGW-Deltaproteobacteria-21]|nr:MAG: signal peptide peptidase SppA [Deltaproteobacteria bacterium HGW-Deltaproteobacteria-21]
MRHAAERNTYYHFLILFLLLLIGLAGCAPRLFKGSSDPLREFTLEGKGDGKVLLIPLRGAVSTKPEEGIFRTKPSMVQEVVSHLRKAQKDPSIKAVLLEIESPGGSVTASDVLYHELEKYKEKSGAKMVTLMMSTAASGGYYVALASDRIIAHPMTLTGSVGTIFVRPNATRLMEKVGLEAEITKSGKYKDMASPFRDTQPEEKEIIRAMIEDLNSRFLELAAKKRGLKDEQYRNVATARIFTAAQAVEAGLVDSIGYMDDALREAKNLSGLTEDAKVVVYRRTQFSDDNPYNPITMEGSGQIPGLIQMPLSEFLTMPGAGFYYLWAPEYEK